MLKKAYGIYLYWLPLGSGGNFVRLNGKVYEAVAARLQQRPTCDLYHSALQVIVPKGRYVIEQTPVIDAHGPERGVVAEGPVGARWAGRFRIFRYEVHRWLDGVIPDLNEAVESPRQLNDDLGQAERLLEIVPEVPILVWGRDEMKAGEMWNSNSISARRLAHRSPRGCRSASLSGLQLPDLHDLGHDEPTGHCLHRDPRPLNVEPGNHDASNRFQGGGGRRPQAASEADDRRLAHDRSFAFCAAVAEPDRGLHDQRYPADRPEASESSGQSGLCARSWLVPSPCGRRRRRCVKAEGDRSGLCPSNAYLGAAHLSRGHRRLHLRIRRGRSGASSSCRSDQCPRNPRRSPLQRGNFSPRGQLGQRALQERTAASCQWAN